MSADRTALHMVTLAASTTCPRIVIETAKATHGPDSERIGHLRQAQALCFDLLSKLQAVERQVEREQPAEIAT